MNENYNQENIKHVEYNLNLLHTIKDALYSDNHIFLDSFYLFVDNENTGELSLKKINKVLKELSIKFGFDLEPAKDFIISRHYHLTGISFPIFKEDLLNFILKQIDNLTNIIFVDNNNLRLDPIERRKLENQEDEENDRSLDEIRRERESIITDNIDMSLLILQRSLYILKKKFEKYQNDMTDIYDKHDPKFTKKITINKFITIMKEIFKECQMSMTEIIKPSDIFKVDYIEHLNPEAANKIIEKLFFFMFNDRDTYNQLIKEKKHIIDKSDEEVLFTVEKRLIAEKISENNANVEMKNTDESSVKKDEKKDQIKPQSKPNDKNSENQDHSEIVKGADKHNEKNKLTNNEELSEIKKKINKESKISNDNTNSKNKEDMGDQQQQVKDKNNSNKIEDQKKDNRTLEKTKTDDSKDTNKNKDEIKEDKILSKKNIDTKIDNKKGDEKVKSSQDNKFETEKNHQEFTAYFPNSIPILYYDSIPLILADFIDKNNEYIILDSSNEFKNELRSLFDGEIMQRIGEQAKVDLDEERAQQIKELLFDKLNLEKNIRNYEDLLVKKKATRENGVFIEKMLDKLRNQLDFVNNRIKQIEENHIAMKQLNNHRPKTNLYKNSPDNHIQYKPQKIKRPPNKDELRVVALKEIFYFYCRQHGVSGKGATFDQIKENLDTLNIGEYIKFCVEFKIPLSKDILAENFKKCSKSSKEMTYDDFIISLNNIAVRINDENIKSIHKRLKILKDGKIDEKVKKKPKKDKLISENLEKLIKKSSKEDIKPNQINYLTELKKLRETENMKSREKDSKKLVTDKDKINKDQSNDLKNNDIKKIIPLNNTKESIGQVDNKKKQEEINSKDIKDEKKNEKKRPLNMDTLILDKSKVNKDETHQDDKTEKEKNIPPKDNKPIDSKDTKIAIDKSNVNVGKDDNKKVVDKSKVNVGNDKTNDNKTADKSKVNTNKDDKTHDNKTDADKSKVNASKDDKPSDNKIAADKNKVNVSKDDKPSDNKTVLDKYKVNAGKDDKTNDNKTVVDTSKLNVGKDDKTNDNKTVVDKSKINSVNDDKTHDNKTAAGIKSEDNKNIKENKTTDISKNNSLKENKSKVNDIEKDSKEVVKDPIKDNKNENKNNIKHLEKESEIKSHQNDPISNNKKSIDTKKEINLKDQKSKEKIPSLLDNDIKNPSHIHDKNNVYEFNIDPKSNKLYYKHKPELLKLKIPITTTHVLINSQIPEKIDHSKIELKEILKDEVKRKNEIEKCNLLLENLNSKKFLNLQENLFQIMNIDNEHQYRNKMIGFVMPFNVHDKQYKIPIEVRLANVKKLDNRSADEIKKIIAGKLAHDSARKEEKFKEQKEKEEEERLRQYQERIRMKKLYERQKQEFIKVNSQEQSYADSKQKKIKYQNEKPKQITWDQLENLNTNYFITNKDDDFNPKDFIDLEDGYDSDDGLVINELKNDKNINNHSVIKNDSTMINESENHSKYSEQKHGQMNNLYKKSKSNGDKESLKTKSMQINNPRPPKYRESISKGEKRVSYEDINLQKKDLLNVNKSVIINTNNTVDRAKQFEKQMEARKDKLLKLNSKQINQGIDKIQKYGSK